MPLSVIAIAIDMYKPALSSDLVGLPLALELAAVLPDLHALPLPLPVTVPEAHVDSFIV